MNLLLFLFGCIASRIAIAYIAYKYSNVLIYMAYIALMISFGFVTIYLFDLRKTGLEVSGGNIWWNDLRPIHASLYFLFALLAFKKNKYAWVPLAIDVILGLSAFLYKYYS